MRRPLLLLTLAAAGLAGPATLAQVAPVPLPADPASPLVLAADTAAGQRAAFDTLPLRSVREVAALAPGVRRDLATGALAVRARPGEPVFVVDGVRQLGGAAVAAVPFEAVRSVRVATEGVPARYGQAAGGLVEVETAAGAETFGGRLEAFSSRATDAYDRDLGALALRGPLGRVGGFALAAEAGRAGDATPVGGPGALVLRDDRLAELVAEPQRVAVFEGGGVRYLALPDAARDAVAAGQLYPAADLRAALGLAPDAQIGLVPTLATFGADDYVRQRADDEPLGDLRLSGTLSLAPAPGLRLRAGGRLGRQTGDATGPLLQARTRFAPGAGLDGERTVGEAWLRAEHRPTTAVELRASASVQADDRTVYPRGFSSGVTDALAYGDVDGDGGAVLRQYAFLSGDGLRRVFAADGQRPPTGLFGLVFLPGAQTGRFTESGRRTDQLAGAVVLRWGAARLELGADVERQTHRLYQLDGLSLAEYARDGDRVRTAPGLPEGGAASYDELPYAVLRPVARYYGYTFNGLAQTDGGSAEQFLTLGADGVPTSTDAAPFRPTIAAGYAEGTARLGALAVRVGLRAERYSRGGETLSDAFANRPVVRAGSLDQRPDGIGEDFAVYFAGGQRGQRVVGFRDLDGQLYDAAGQRAGIRDIEALNGLAVIDEDAAPGAAFTASPAHTTLQPRLGLRLSVSPAVSVAASYDRLSRQPPPELYSTVADYASATSRSVLADPRLRPEAVDALRVGVDAQVAPALAVAVAAFHRRTDGDIGVRQVEASLGGYALVSNVGDTRETGGDLALAWTPTARLSATASYSLSVAEATNADPATFATLVIEGGFPAGVFEHAPDGARHEIDAALALRTPARLGGLDLGLTLSAQSGLPYTALDPDGQRFTVGDSFTGDISGGVNGTRLPWTSQLDVRLGRSVRLGGAAVELFGWVENLLGADNVLAVYRATGRPDADGFLESPAGGALPPGEREVYRAYTGGPVNVGGNQSTAAPFFYGQPRQIRLGVRATL